MKKKILFIVFLGVLFWAFGGLLVMFTIYFETKIPISWKMYAWSLLLIPIMGIIVSILGYFGLYLPRFGPPFNPKDSI